MTNSTLPMAGLYGGSLSSADRVVEEPFIETLEPRADNDRSEGLAVAVASARSGACVVCAIGLHFRALRPLCAALQNWDFSAAAFLHHQLSCAVLCSAEHLLVRCWPAMGHLAQAAGRLVWHIAGSMLCMHCLPISVCILSTLLLRGQLQSGTATYHGMAKSYNNSHIYTDMGSKPIMNRSVRVAASHTGCLLSHHGDRAQRNATCIHTTVHDSGFTCLYREDLPLFMRDLTLHVATRLLKQGRSALAGCCSTCQSDTEWQKRLL